MQYFRFSTVILASASTLLPLSAGVRIKSERTDLSNNQTSQEEMLLDTNRFRADTDKNQSVMFLTDGGRNRIVILDKAKNTYQEIDQQTMNQLSQQMSAAMNDVQAKMAEAMKNMTPEQRAMMEQVMKGKMPAGMPAAAAPQPTVYTANGSGSVAGFSCTKYTGMRGSEKEAELCASTASQLKLTESDLQIVDKMREFGASLTAGLRNSPMSSNLSQFVDKGVNGFPIQRTDYSNGKATHKSELKSLERTNFSDADFSVGNAKKVDFPIPQVKGKGK